MLLAQPRQFLPGQPGKALPGIAKKAADAWIEFNRLPLRLARSAAEAINTGSFTPLKKEVAAVIGPVVRSAEKLKQITSMTAVLLSEAESRDMLLDFVERYWDNTHPLEKTEMGAEAASDVVMTILLAIFTAGVGAAANIVAKSGRLVKVANLLKKLAATLKRVRSVQRLPKKPKAAKPRKVNKKHPKSMPNGQTPKKQVEFNKEKSVSKKKPVANKKFKRKHLDGDPKDPYTLMPDGKPLGADVGQVPVSLQGLKKLPKNHDKYVKDGWPSLNVEYAPGRYTNDFRNFTDAKPGTLEPGTKIYRIIDDQSCEFQHGVSGSYWATELPENKSVWRKEYAVKDSWNDNGYYIEETVGPEGLKVWRGGTAAQRYEDSDFFLAGGKEQIFVQRDGISDYKPKLTNWLDL